jgi:Divergent InlB B-repeat domain
MRRRLILAATLTITALLMLGGVTASQAAPGSLRILFVNNQGDGDFTEFIPALRGMPGVATLDTFESSAATPSAEGMASYDLIVNTGDSDYGDQALYGNRLADYIDAGGALIQFAYDNWEDPLAHPTGRFESGGYAPFIPGDNDNVTTSLGSILVPSSPLLAGVPSFTTDDNTTDAVAPGATLLALYADGRNAIATKGRVVSVTASLQDGSGFSPFSAAAQLAVNAGNVLGRHTITVKKAGRGSGTVTSAPAGIKCGKNCAATFAGATSITLTAKAKKGRAFTGWKGVAGCKKRSRCKFTPTANTTTTATFGCKKEKKGKRSAGIAKTKKCKKKR